MKLETTQKILAATLGAARKSNLKPLALAAPSKPLPAIADTSDNDEAAAIAGTTPQD
jgi:hypothetical protein